MTKIIRRGVIDILTGKVLEEDAYDYFGPLTRCMPDARNLGDLSQCFPLIPAAANAAAPTTGSGAWTDTENWCGDGLIVVSVGSVTGSFGSLKVQLQTSTANTGASAANATNDPRNAGLLTITATGTYVMPFNTDYLANNFVGVVCTYTTITASVFGVTLLGRLANN